MIDQKFTYQDLLTSLIKQEVLVLGPSVVLAQARKINGLEVEESGRVLKISQEPQQVLAELIKNYLSLSTLVTQQILNSLSSEYPDLKI